MFKFENGQLSFKCPNCHSDEPILKTLAEGNEMLNPKDKVGTKHQQLVLASDDKIKSGVLAGKKAKIVWAHYDICGKCGSEYAYLIELNEVEVRVQHQSGEKKIILPGMQPGLQFPPPPGRAS